MSFYHLTGGTGSVWRHGAVCSNPYWQSEKGSIILNGFMERFRTVVSFFISQVGRFQLVFAFESSWKGICLLPRFIVTFEFWFSKTFQKLNHWKVLKISGCDLNRSFTITINQRRLYIRVLLTWLCFVCFWLDFNSNKGGCNSLNTLDLQKACIYVKKLSDGF